MMGDNKQKDPSPNDARERFVGRMENRHETRSNPACRSTAELLDAIHDLTGEHSGLVLRDSALQRAQQALAVLYQQFEDLYERAPCGYLTLDPDGLITRINPAGAILLQGLREDILHTAFSGYIPSSRQNRYHHALRKAVDSKQKQSVEMHRFGTDGTEMWLWAEISADGDKAGNLLQWRMTLVDISSKKKAEIALKASEHKYRVSARQSASEIRQINRALRREVEARKVAQMALLEKSQELEACSLRLKEANTALKVLLRERDSDRRELEERVVCNINELIRPHLLKLAEGDWSQRRKALINAISSGLDDITSPLSKRFLVESARLTPVENQVAGLIRQGRTTKEISKLVGVAPSTVDFHRFNIRRKLNLTNKRTNLQSYLRSLT